MAEEDYAIVIAISRYPQLKDLQGPVKDAEDFAEWLEKFAEVPKKNIKTVASDNPPAPGNRPVLDEIDDAFADTFGAARQKQARRLYLYFAGHGCAAESDHVALLMANASLEQPNRSINTRRYHEGLARRALFPEQIIFYDCCRNYDRRVPGRGPAWPEDDPEPEAGSIAQFILYAAAFTQYSNERAIDFSERRGLFTKALLEGLRGQAAIRKGGEWVVTTESLPAYVQTRLQQIIEDQQLSLRQAVVRGPGLVKEMTLAKVQPQLQQVTVKTDGLGDTLVVKNQTLKEIMRVPINRGKAQIELSPGWYFFVAEPSGVGRAEEVREAVPNVFTLGGD